MLPASPFTPYPQALSSTYIAYSETNGIPPKTPHLAGIFLNERFPVRWGVLQTQYPISQPNYLV